MTRQRNEDRKHLPVVTYFEDSLPEHFHRWIRIGFLVGGLGYAAVSLSTEIASVSRIEMCVSVFCLLAFALERRFPRATVYAVLFLVWAELMWSLGHDPSGPRASSSLALPVWILGAALFVGRRFAWAMAVVTSAFIPCMILWVDMDGRGAEILKAERTYLVVLVATLLGTATVISAFLSTLLVSVRREREAALRAAHLVEESPDAMIAVSAGRVMAFNSLAEEYFGVERSKVLGEEFEKLPFWGNSTPQIYLLGDQNSTQELQVEGRALEMRVRRLLGEDGRPEQLLVLRDVSERKAAESRTKELSTQLQHSQKLEAIGQLAGGIAHDFNNLLTAFAGSAELLLDSKEPRTRELAKGIAKASDRGAALTRQLLTFARRETIQAQIFDLSAVIEGTRSLLAHLLGERVSLIFDFSKDCFVRADRSQVEQIILNLAANAKDAMGGTGTLSITTRVKAESVILEVQDTGTGMDEGTKRRIFEPFFTTKSRDRGTGLGLSTVHGIVEQWEGTVRVESSLGRGAKFIVEWPLSCEPVEENKVVSRISSSPSRPSVGKVLFVEDDEGARNITERLMTRSGLLVTSATSAEEALALVRDGFIPDILVSDVIMRGLTGVDLAERLRKNRPNLPVLFISGYVDDVLRDWPFDTTKDLLLKPFSTDEFLSRIDEKLREGRKKRSDKKS